jgi:phosphoglucosamine mutase
MDEDPDRGVLAASDELGRAKRIEDAQAPLHRVRQAHLPRNLTSTACASSSIAPTAPAYKVAPDALWELGAEVIQIGTSPTASTSTRCGSTAPRRCARRCARCAPTSASRSTATPTGSSSSTSGQVVDGDQLMALVADVLAAARRLRGGGLVATIMSNLGLERYLAGLGLTLARTGGRPLRGGAHAGTASTSAASSPAISSCRTTRRPATGSGRPAGAGGGEVRRASR